MAVDTPARIVILGAGPVGLEAGLYARYLGYGVEILERGQIADHVRQWGHVALATPFRMNRSPLGLAALAAQDAKFLAPEPDALLTGHEWVRQYLGPLSRTDLLADSIRTETAVIAVTRRDRLKTERVRRAVRRQSPFRIVAQGPQGREMETSADVVIDATGVFGNPNWMGQGGAPALGECRHRASIEYGVPDILGREKSRYAGRRILLVGCGEGAAVTVIALARLARDVPATRITWVTGPLPQTADGPVVGMPADPLEERSRRAAAANAWARAPGEGARVWHGTFVHALAFDSAAERWTVTFGGDHAGQGEFDRVVADVGFRPDTTLYRELQLGHSRTWESPFAATKSLSKNRARRGSPTPPKRPTEGLPAGLWIGSKERRPAPQTAVGDPADPSTFDPGLLLLPEPNFYVLGAKSQGRRAGFLFCHGLAQIRGLFSVIGGRANLDLYASVQNLLR